MGYVESSYNVPPGKLKLVFNVPPGMLKGGTLKRLNRPEAGTIKFILPEFVSYLGKRGVLCVGNG